MRKKELVIVQEADGFGPPTFVVKDIGGRYDDNSVLAGQEKYLSWMRLIRFSKQRRRILRRFLLTLLYCRETRLTTFLTNKISDK
ncbi:hypothetical protein I633_21846 (plasmid) [Alteromonas mediterranea 615]|uniref:Uncharacterized protein n=1 Tax=Alteromonas mediterranea 615 TaxID=1300253 RepID=S5ALP2_9ALTE|nr:hypothetical protein I633_21846 [Alteromonas mediterranea 615]